VKINYQIEMERELARIEASGRRPRLLLHACCAPCGSYVLEALNRAFDIDVFYYNPNIAPRAEFDRRVAELQRLAEHLPHENELRVIVGDYDNPAFMTLCRGHEDDPEGGARCALCFRMRLEAAAKMAARLHSDYFTTSLTISPLKDAQLLNAIGAAQGRSEGVNWLFSDFKKKNGYKRSCELSREYSLYRQDYCGCVFSRRERDERMKNGQG
jgi:predicted adenine nucleotide alpha hydrolase (AANH) superfamily ATPase